jgi:hypothetical protein
MTRPPQPPDLPAPARAGDRPGPPDRPRSPSGDDRGAVPADLLVPIIVWRVVRDDPPAGLASPTGLSPRLAAQLIRLYTDPADTVVDLTADPAIAGAAGAGGCRYLPVDHPASLPRLDHLTGTVRLVVLRWPPTTNPAHTDADADADPAATAELTGLLAGCRPLLATDGYTIVALRPVRPHSHYVDHARQLIPAAYQAGLGYLEHVLVVTTPITGRPHPAAPADPAALDLATGPQPLIDLLVFVLHGTGRAAKARR